VRKWGREAVSMDPLAHTLTGIALAKSGVEKRIGKGSVLALILASNMVDVDVVGAFLFDEPTWTYRRMWTHSLFMAPLFASLGAFLFSLYFRQASFFKWLLVFLLGVSFHVFMDLINSYGVVLLFPFSKERFELAWVFIIDLFIWSALLLSLVLPKIKKTIDPIKSARLGVLVLLLYLSLSGGLRELSSKRLENYAREQGYSYTFNYVFPEPFGPLHFRGVLRDKDTYRVYLIEPVSGEVVLHNEYTTDVSDPEVIHLVGSKAGKKYTWFFKAPVWKKLQDGNAIVSDLRFKSILLDREAPFTYLVGEDVPLGRKLK
jgi:inner membrane protein